MSFCRFSCDDWRSSVYCYEDLSGGFTTHVAGNRVVGDIPKCPVFSTVPPEEWWAAYGAQMAFLETTERMPIELPHAGGSFNDPSLEALRDRLIDLRTLGYHVPDHALSAIEDEIADALSAPSRLPT